MKTVLFIFALLSLSIAQQCYMTQALRQILLDAHNKLRQRVASGSVSGQPNAQNMRALSWDPELEQWATNWAGRCLQAHRETRATVVGDYFGENIFWQFSVAPMDVRTFNVSSAVQQWFDEVKDFQSSKIASFVAQKPGEKVTGHYTQVAWADVTSVGCGISYCQNTKLSQPYFITIVCNYKPGGNFVKAVMYKAGPPSCAANGMIANNQYNALCGSIDASKISYITSSTCPAEPKSTSPSTQGQKINGWTHQDATKWAADSRYSTIIITARAISKQVIDSNYGSSNQFVVSAVNSIKNQQTTSVFTSLTSVKLAQKVDSAAGDQTYYTLVTCKLSSTGNACASVSVIVQTTYLNSEQLFPKITSGSM